MKVERRKSRNATPRSAAFFAFIIVRVIFVCIFFQTYLFFHLSPSSPRSWLRSALGHCLKGPCVPRPRRRSTGKLSVDFGCIVTTCGVGIDVLWCRQGTSNSNFLIPECPTGRFYGRVCGAGYCAYCSNSPTLEQLVILTGLRPKLGSASTSLLTG